MSDFVSSDTRVHSPPDIRFAFPRILQKLVYLYSLAKFEMVITSTISAFVSVKQIMSCRMILSIKTSYLSLLIKPFTFSDNILQGL